MPIPSDAELLDLFCDNHFQFNDEGIVQYGRAVLALRCESVSVTLTETDRSDLRVAANIIDRDGPSPIGVELSATLRRIASAGVDVHGEGQR